MEALIILVLYLAIGFSVNKFVDGLFEDDDTDISLTILCIIMWPIVILLGLLMLIAELIYKIITKDDQE